MGEQTELSALNARWAAWLLARNRRSTLLSLWLVIGLYPIFGVLDYMVCPRHWLWVLWGTRAVITAITLVMFWIIRSALFTRHANLFSAGFQIVISCGISLMTIFMGGLGSPYYAGLSLIMVGIALLFVWPRHVVVATHAGIVASFLLPNLIIEGSTISFAAVSNLFFLVSTALIAGTGQIVIYRLQHEQIATQLVIESTKTNLERAHSELQRLDRFKSEFFANITHELKTPLTMILASLELMIEGEMGKATDAQRASLSSMLRAGVKLLRLIGDLLDLSKLDESRLRLQVAEHDLVGYLRELCLEVQPLTKRKSIDLRFESNVEACPTHCDLEQLERVFVNLLSNAAKFTPGNGTIRLQLFDLGTSVRVSVVDSGIGFPPGMAERIFERFFQVDMAGTRKFGGAGIGLSLARRLVLLHGGRIAAESAPDGGATVTVELPKDRAHFDPDHLDRRARREDRLAGNRESDRGVGDWQVEAKSRFRLIEIDEATDQRIVARDPDDAERGQSVLVVEDTPDVIRLIHLALRSEFRVLAASSGLKGLELATKHIPSLVITDFMMPEIDGMELTRQLRADPRTRHIPIIMLTARGDLQHRVAGLEAGANVYLAKPFSTKELVTTVRGLVRIQETAADLLLTHNMDSLETIAGRLAHEINNPLNYVKSALCVIRQDADAVLEIARGSEASRLEPAASRTITDASARMTRMFGIAESGVQRIGATIDLMQRYSRDGYTRIEQPFDLFDAARDVVAMLQAGVDGSVVESHFQGNGVVTCVPEELNQVITNLVQNALDAVRHNSAGRVRVIGANDNGVVVLSVEDNGMGIAPEDRMKIFTPFYTTKDVGVGMGLGLTIVHRVVASLGGTVAVTSSVGAGAEFTLRIPQKLEARARAEARSEVTRAPIG